MPIPAGGQTFFRPRFLHFLITLHYFINCFFSSSVSSEIKTPFSLAYFLTPLKSSLTFGSSPAGTGPDIFFTWRQYAWKSYFFLCPSIIIHLSDFFKFLWFFCGNGKQMASNSRIFCCSAKNFFVLFERLRSVQNLQFHCLSSMVSFHRSIHLSCCFSLPIIIYLCKLIKLNPLLQYYHILQNCNELFFDTFRRLFSFFDCI